MGIYVKSVLLLWCLLVQGSVQQNINIKDVDPITFQIAGIFDEVSYKQQLNAFNESMSDANVLETRLSPVIITPPRMDSYSVWRALCLDTTMKPIAIFGPQTAITDGAIRDQSIAANLPHIQATWQPQEPDLDLTSETDEDPEAIKKMTINFYPDADSISIAHAKLLSYYGWENCAALYEDDYGLMRIQKILAIHTTNFPVIVRRLDPFGDNYGIFKELRKFKQSRILIDCDVDRITKYVDEAIALDMVNPYQHYIFLTLDASIYAEELSELSCNVTWLSLTEFDKINAPQHDLAPRVSRWMQEKPSKISPSVSKFKTESLMMDDIAKHVLIAFAAIRNTSENENFLDPSESICSTSAGWKFGSKLQQEILKTQTTGVTGNIEFNEKGKRVNYTLYVNEGRGSIRRTVGTWSHGNPDEITIDTSLNDANETEQIRKHFKVIAKIGKPYFYKKQVCEGEGCEEDDDPEQKYQGFSVDLIKEIFAMLKDRKYTYEFVVKEDTSHGSYDPVTKKWNGLIGELLDKNADLAVGDITITEERKKVVDFSVPFMNLGISILFMKEIPEKPGKFAFLNPYSIEVWMYTATAYCVVTIVLFLCSRISPADWENPQPCDKDPEELENIWNFKNCAWLTMGSIMTQGCDILPKAFGSRWVCGMWWFFAMIVCQTYIAQLAASMTSALASEPINNVEDLAQQNKILYGALEGGSTVEFFKNSKDKTFRKIYENMMKNPVVLVKSNDEGEKRVLNGKNKYAFFMESCTIEYKLKRNCKLMKIGGDLDSKDYGIAMPANSPFRSPINRAILQLKEHTRLEGIKNKWWNSEKYGAQACETEKDEGDVEGDLEVENLIGLFMVLGVGLVICLFITAAEFMDEVRNIVVRERVSHKEAFIKELRASLNFFQLQKPVLRNPSRASSIAASVAPEEKKAEKVLKQAALLDNFIDFEKEVQ